jgi:hypothetical protein
MENNIKQLRAFFDITIASFEFFNTIKKATGNVESFGKMYELHKSAQAELSKTNPDLSVVKKLITEIETLAESSKSTNPYFPSGGVELNT